MNKSLNALPFQDITELKRSITDSLTNIRGIITKANPLIVLIQLHIYKFLNYFGNIEAMVHGNVKPFENKMIDFTQSLLVTSLKTEGTGYLDKCQLSNLIKELDRLYTIANIYVIVAPKDELIKYSQGIQMNVSGNMYPYFEKDHFTDIFSPYTELLEEIYGITSNQLVNGLLAISKQLRTMSFMENIINRNILTDQQLSEEELLGLADYFNVQSITGWPLEFIEDLSLKQGEWTDFYENDLQVMVKEPPIKYKPFIGIEDQYYCFSIDNLIDNFYRTVLRAMRRKKSTISNIINNIQKDLSESLPFKFFKRILPSSQMFENIFYKAPVGENGKK